MPQAIPAIVSWVGTALWSATWVTVAKIAIVVGSALYSRNQAKKAQRAFASLRDQGTTVTFSDPMAVAALVYGECRIGGVVIHAETTGASNSSLHQVIALAPHDLSEIDDIYFGDEALGMPWNGGSPSNVPDVTSPYYGKTRINRKIGGGSADSELVAESGGGWTSTDKMTGIASIYVRTQWDVDVFPQGLSFNISTDVKGKECYDPRDTTTAYKNNNALVLRDYLTEHLGYPTAEIDDADVNAAANICDESVTIADATSQKRYTFNGRILTDTKPADARQMIARAMGGWCAKIGGKWRMEAGAAKSSSLSLTPDDFIGEIEWLNQDPISDACNAVRVTYLDPKNNWQPATAPLVRKLVTAPNITAGARCTIVSLGTTNFTLIGAASNTVGLTFTASGAGTGTGTVDPYLGEDNGVEHVRDIDLFGVTNEATALRLGRIELERARHGLTFTTQTGLKGLKVQAGDWVDVTFSRYGWTSKLFEVVEHRTVHEVQESGMFISIRLVLREVSSAIYSRTAADETTADPAPNTTLQNPRDVIAPVLGTLESDDAQLTIDSRGQVVSRIKVPWTCADVYVTSGGTFELEYKLSADTDWLPAPIAPPKGSDQVAWIGPVTDGEDYDVRIRAVNGIGVHSDWDTETAHTVIGKSDPPDAPTSFTATATAGGVLLEWVPPPDLDLEGHDIFHAPNGDPIPADPQFSVAAPAFSFVVPGLTVGESTDFWIKARDTSGNRSTAVGPETTAADPVSSPTLWPRGTFSPTAFYLDNDDVKNLVRYSGSVYKANNTSKSGLDTWDTPGTSSDWVLFANEDLVTASGLILAETGYIYNTLYVGDGTADKGKVMTYGVTGFGAGAEGVFLGMNGTKGALYAGVSAGDHLSYYNGTAEVVGKLIKLGALGTQFVLDVDSSFVGPNPPARMTFGTMQALNTGTATALNFSTGSGSGIRWTGGTGFAIGNSFVSTYQIDTVTGNGYFADLHAADDLTVTDRLYIGTTDCEFYRDAADVIRTPDSIQAQGFGAYGGITAYAASSSDFVFLASYVAGACIVKAVPFTVADSSNVAKFTVAHATGNTSIAGTLGVSGNTTLSGSLSVAGAVTSAMTFNSTVAITGALTVGASGTIYLGVDCEIARTAVNTLTTPDTFVALGLQTNGGDLLVYNGGDKFRAQASNGSILIQGTLVVTARQTGWGAPTGTLTRTTFDPSTATLQQGLERLAALITDLRTHGLIGN